MVRPGTCRVRKRLFFLVLHAPHRVDFLRAWGSKLATQEAPTGISACSLQYFNIWVVKDCARPAVHRSDYSLPWALRALCVLVVDSKVFHMWVRRSGQTGRGVVNRGFLSLTCILPKTCLRTSSALAAVDSGPIPGAGGGAAPSGGPQGESRGASGRSATERKQDEAKLVKKTREARSLCPEVQGARQTQ